MRSFRFGGAISFFAKTGLEERAVQSKCPVDTCDRERPRRPGRRESNPFTPTKKQVWRRRRCACFFTGKGFEGRAAQSNSPVDTCDRERPSAHCALFRRIPGKHCCAGLRSTASSNLTGASLPAFSSLFSTIYLAIRCRFFAETERGARIESLHSDQSENPVVQAAGFSLCIVPFSIFSFQYSLRIDRIF